MYSNNSQLSWLFLSTIRLLYSFIYKKRKVDKLFEQYWCIVLFYNNLLPHWSIIYKSFSTVENSMKILLKTRNKTVIWPSIPTTGSIPWENHNWKNIHTPVFIVVMCVCAHLCQTPCNPMDGSPPASSVPGIFLARILEWVAIFYSRGSSWPRDWTHVSCISKWVLYHCATWEFHPLATPLPAVFIAVLFTIARTWKQPRCPLTDE